MNYHVVTKDWFLNTFLPSVQSEVDSICEGGGIDSITLATNPSYLTSYDSSKALTYKQAYTWVASGLWNYALSRQASTSTSEEETTYSVYVSGVGTYSRTGIRSITTTVDIGEITYDESLIGADADMLAIEDALAFEAGSGVTYENGKWVYSSDYEGFPCIVQCINESDYSSWVLYVRFATTSSDNAVWTAAAGGKTFLSSCVAYDSTDELCPARVNIIGDSGSITVYVYGFYEYYDISSKSVCDTYVSQGKGVLLNSWTVAANGRVDYDDDDSYFGNWFGEYTQYVFVVA